MIEAYFGLSKAPFRLGTDEEFYFDSSLHNRALAYLKYGLQQGEGIVVLTGEAGVGKTTLIEHFLNEVDSNIIASKMIGTKLEPGEILPQVISVFGADHHGKNFAAQMKALESYFAGQVTAGKQVALIIDEAQSLTSHSLDELRLLANLSVAGHALVQVFLIGQPELRERLAQKEMEHFRQRVVVSWTLKELNLEETGDYIDHRMMMAGWDEEESLFTDEAIGKIFEFTSGVPRLVNRICARLLVGAALEEADFVDVGLVDQIIDEMKDEGLASSKVEARLERDAAIIKAPDDAGAVFPQKEKRQVVVPFTSLKEKPAKVESQITETEILDRTGTDDRDSDPAPRKEPPMMATKSSSRDHDNFSMPSVLDRMQAAAAEQKKSARKETPVQSETSWRGVSLEDVANEIRSVSKEVSEPILDINFDDEEITAAEQDIEEAPVVLETIDDDDFEMEFDDSEDDLSDIDEPEGENLSQLKQNLSDFVLETRDGLNAVAESLATISKRLDSIDDRRSRRNQMLDEKLAEVDELLNALRSEDE